MNPKIDRISDLTREIDKMEYLLRDGMALAAGMRVTITPQSSKVGFIELEFGASADRSRIIQVLLEETVNTREFWLDRLTKERDEINNFLHGGVKP